ncbi:MAG: NAD-dependent epimerase/dehydratase [Bacteroidetes bacterium OLB11]|nr:MAG: NAD-dependent epimerase/dehydratase [Bacteroidetes bacterium OLB11]
MQRKHILITGASGTVGSEILKLITQFPEYQITCFDIVNKKNKKFFNQYKNKIQWITGDISNESEVKKIPSQIDVVIHLAALIPPSADLYPHLTQKINVLGTKLLLNHLEKTSPQVFFIYSSSIALYGDRVENPYIRVSDPIKISEGDYYAETKMAAEQLVQQSSLRWSIFRLAAIMKNHKISKLMFHMPLKTHFEICTPNDTANAFVKAISNQEQLQFRIFNLGGGEKSRTSYQKFLENSFKIYGLGRLDFPENSFATKNFHCGYLADGDDLENILHFRNDTLKSYYHTTQASFPLYKKLAASLFSKIIKYYLLKQSEPYQAYKSDNQEMMQRFFKKNTQSKYSFKNEKKNKNSTPLPYTILQLIDFKCTTYNFKNIKYQIKSRANVYCLF